jgi:hypothetical protein
MSSPREEFNGFYPKVTVEELRNVVYVDEEAPNNVTVSIGGGSGAGAGWSYGSGAPWTIEIILGE